jgi:ABC-type antimicrobial peptide transport system permease subunit
MNKKKTIFLIIAIILIIAVVIALVVIGNAKSKKQEEKIKKDDIRDNAAFKLIDEACDNLIDENGNYNIGGAATEVVCEKGFCHITYNGEDYGLECKEA